MIWELRPGIEIIEKSVKLTDRRRWHPLVTFRVHVTPEFSLRCIRADTVCLWQKSYRIIGWILAKGKASKSPQNSILGLERNLKKFL